MYLSAGQAPTEEKKDTAFTLSHLKLRGLWSTKMAIQTVVMSVRKKNKFSEKT